MIESRTRSPMTRRSTVRRGPEALFRGDKEDDMSYANVIEAALREAVVVTMTEDSIAVTIPGLDGSIDVDPSDLHRWMQAVKDRDMRP